MKLGDYVLATKWGDGSPHDQWAVGFYAGEMAGRHMVVDAEGNTFLAGGFRKVAKITKARGEFILNNKGEIMHSGRSLWYWKRATMQHIGHKALE